MRLRLCQLIPSSPTAPALSLCTDLLSRPSEMLLFPFPLLSSGLSCAEPPGRQQPRDTNVAHCWSWPPLAGGATAPKGLVNMQRGRSDTNTLGGHRALLRAGSLCWSSWEPTLLQELVLRQGNLPRISSVAVYRAWTEPQYGRAAELLSIFIAFYSLPSCFLNKSNQSMTSGCISLEMETSVLLIPPWLHTPALSSPLSL